MPPITLIDCQLHDFFSDLALYYERLYNRKIVSETEENGELDSSVKMITFFIVGYSGFKTQ
jgi:hypothetical protein